MDKHKHCEDLLQDLSDFIDGIASEELCEAIEHHMSDCPNCRIMVDTVRKTLSLYQEREADTTLPHDVRFRLIRTLNLDDLLPDA
jgi:predicted anti-sigma-YlaC factor YlaD